ncbi:MAG: hypothetical protein QE271_03550 [Bacteriovoracaceae bacterium]|nr:hypothetical protein [Bacteriovoracaceae bacterium]
MTKYKINTKFIFSFFYLFFFLSCVNVFSATTSDESGLQDEEMSPEEFKSKLTEMFNRVNKSIKLLRDQITENQSAPFLANLYMQLGDLIAQKANVLYYIKMESTSNDGPPDSPNSDNKDKKFKDVVDATKEAISIYEKVIKEFPKFVGRPRAMYSLALALKSIDEPQKFLMVTNDLLKSYPGSKDACKGQLLLGQHLFERGIFDESMKQFEPMTKIKYVYERNLAKYKRGLIYLADGKHKPALDSFVEVVVDKEFKETDNEAEVNLKKKSVRTDLKREALIDSIRAYTEVYKKDPDGVRFYSNIAPSESVFQEVIEKLAFRYISIKEYSNAIVLLRVLSERTASPEKVLTIYKEVLLMIPLNDRITLPVNEIRYVLEKYVQWINYYKLSDTIKKSAFDFFEKQLRDLATRAHEKGKTEGDVNKRNKFLKNATEFYDLYLALFPKTPFTGKMALNMGDAYFRMNDFMRCGDYYLRAYKEEFGKIADKNLVLKNAVFCLQKEKEYSFYELRRVKGLLIESITLLMELDPAKKNDAKTNFSLVKAKYDQGFYQIALEELMSFMKRFGNTSYAVDAANLILDYYNIKSDFAGLMESGAKILALNLPNAELNQKVKEIREQAKYKKLQAQVESSASFDGFAQGKSYLENAGSIKNVELRNLALSRALEASRRERDIDTFFRSAQLIASKENDPSKRYEIELSMAQEHVKMGNFSEGGELYQKIYSGPYTPTQKQDSFNEYVIMITAMRDWDKIAGVVGQPMWNGVNAQIKSQLQDQVANALESPITIGPGLQRLARNLSNSPAVALGLYKASTKNSSLKSVANASVSQNCSQGRNTDSVCRWKMLEEAHKNSQKLIQQMRTSNGNLNQMEQFANAFSGLVERISSLEGGQDVSLDVLSSLQLAELYIQFGDFLAKVAQGNAQVAQILAAKAQESKVNGNNFKLRCRKIIQSSGIITPYNKSCYQGKMIPPERAWVWSNTVNSSVKRSDRTQFLDLKKQVFSSYNAASVLKLAQQYYSSGNYHYAAAVAIYGQSATGKSGEFSTLLGCSVMQMGYYNEAGFYLKSGADLGGLKSSCMGRLKGLAN